MTENLDEIRKKKEEWERDVLTPALEKMGPKREMKLVGIGHLEWPVKEIYTPLDLEEIGFDYLKDVGFPGAYPFVRWSEPTKDPDRPWLMRIYAGYGTPEQSNERYKFLRDEGAEEIVLAVDLPCQIGYDPDHPLAAGEVGRVGVSLASLRDMEIMFDGIPLNTLRRVGLLGNSFGPIALAFFIALGEKQGLTTDDFVVHLQNDVLKEYGARGTQFLPVEPAVRLAADTVAYCARHQPHWNPINVCAAHYQVAGGPASHAFMLASAKVYIDELISKGLDVDEFAPLFNLFIGGEATFTGAALARAVRKLWARMLKEDYGARDPRSMAVKLTAYALGDSTARQPLNNIIRIALATQTFALAGLEYIWNASYDEGLAIPTDEAARLCLRTQQILAKETELPFVIDPFAGSYFVETLTAQLESKIQEYLDEIEQLGGIVKAITQGYVMRKSLEQAMARRIGTETGEKPVVGVNCFQVEEEEEPVIFKPDPKVMEKRLKSLTDLKKERNNAAVQRCLDEVKEVCASGENVVPAVLEAVKAYATLGEICDAWREVFGEYEFGREF